VPVAIRLGINQFQLNISPFRDRLKIITIAGALRLLRPSQPNTIFFADIGICVEWRLCDTTHKRLQRQYRRLTEGECAAREEIGTTDSVIGKNNGW
jgi:hypothetical protein